MNKNGQKTLLKYRKSLVNSTKSKIKKEYQNALKNINGEIATYNANLSDWTYSEMAKYDRLTKLRKSIESNIKSMQTKKIIKDGIKDTISGIYEKNKDNYANVLGVTVRSLAPKTIQALLEHPFFALTFVGSMKDLSLATAKKINSIVLQSLIQGDTIKETARSIQSAMGSSLKRAETIARTEIFRASQVAQLASVDELEKHDIQVRKVWLYTYAAAEPRPSHLEMDGVEANKNGEFEVDGYFAPAPVMFGVPEEDINCHCTFYEEVI